MVSCLLITYSLRLPAHNFESICCTAVKLNFMESPSKMALNEYDFVKFLKHKFGTFFKKKILSQKVINILHCALDMLTSSISSTALQSIAKIPQLQVG